AACLRAGCRAPARTRAALRTPSTRSPRLPLSGSTMRRRPCAPRTARPDAPGAPRPCRWSGETSGGPRSVPACAAPLRSELHPMGRVSSRRKSRLCRPGPARPRPDAAASRCRSGNGRAESLCFIRTLDLLIIPMARTKNRRWGTRRRAYNGRSDMLHTMKTRRAFLQAAAVLGGAAATHSLINVTRASAAGPAKVDMQLGWLASNGVLGEVVAAKKGFFAEEGVEFSITPGGPNIDGVAGVASGQRQLGQTSSSPSVMLARSAGIPIKAIAAGYQKHPFTYFSLAKDPI